MLDLGTDIGLRRAWMHEESFGHPAKLHLKLLQWIVDRYTRPGDTVADPMCGIGGLLLAAANQRNVILREIEPRWLELAHRNAALVYARAGLLAGRIEIGQADAREPWGWTCDHLIFSPPYSCAASSTPNQRRFLPYRLAVKTDHTYSDRWRQLAAGNSSGASGAVQFFYGSHPAQIGHLRSAAYWDAMRPVYTHAHAALRSHGHMILIVKDHVRHGQRVHVADETVSLCASLGFVLQECHARRVWPVSLWQRRRKERGELIVETEDVLVFGKAAS